MTSLLTIIFPALLIITLIGFIIPKNTRQAYGIAVAAVMFMLIFTLGWENHQQHSIVLDLVSTK